MRAVRRGRGDARRASSLNLHKPLATQQIDRPRQRQRPRVKPAHQLLPRRQPLATRKPPPHNIIAQRPRDSVPRLRGAGLFGHDLTSYRNRIRAPIGSRRRAVPGDVARGVISLRGPRRLHPDRRQPMKPPAQDALGALRVGGGVTGWDRPRCGHAPQGVCHGQIDVVIHNAFISRRVEWAPPASGRACLAGERCTPRPPSSAPVPASRLGSAPGTQRPRGPAPPRPGGATSPGVARGGAMSRCRAGMAWRGVSSHSGVQRLRADRSSPLLPGAISCH